MMDSVTLEKGKTVIGMAEYIEREALRDALYDADAITMNGVKIINQFPSSDVTTVRHGQWIMGTGENGLQRGYRECSRCGEIVKYGYSLYGVHNFCNYCGAKMDGDDNA